MKVLEKCTQTHCAGVIVSINDRKQITTLTEAERHCIVIII